MNGCSPTRPPKAFTLVEIIMVIVIMGILAGMVTISLSSTDATTASAAADIIARDIELARSEAERTQSPIYVVFSTGNDSYSIATDTAGNSHIVHPIKGTSTTIFIDDEIDTGTVSITSANFGTSGNTLAFNAYGEPVATDLSTPISDSSKVVVRCGDVSYSVMVKPIVGRVLVQSGS